MPLLYIETARLASERDVCDRPQPAAQSEARSVHETDSPGVAASGPPPPSGVAGDIDTAKQAGVERWTHEPRRGATLMERLAEVNTELWLILSLLIIAGTANYLVVSQKIVLGFYTLPTVFAAYFRGRRHATLTAVASALLVGLLTHFKPSLWSDGQISGLLNGQLLDIVAWGSMLILTAYAMGTLYERQAARSQELQQTYQGLLLMLRQFINNDKYNENHSYRVSVYAVTIAQHMGLSPDRLELVRAAALLHDLGKLETSREVLHKAAELSASELREVRQHAQRGAPMLEPVAASMGRILPIILAHHDHFDGSDYHPLASEDIPLEARIISVADVYDALTSDRPYRKAFSPHDAKEIILAGSGKEYDPQVVLALRRAMERGLLEVPEIYV